MADQTTSILLRIPPKLKAEIQDAAKKDRRSTNGQVIVALEEYLARRKA